MSLRLTYPLLILFILCLPWGCSNTKESNASKEEEKEEKTQKNDDERLKNVDLNERIKKIEPDSAQMDSLKKQKNKKELFARHERTPCYGKCPVYELRIEANGHATLKVERNLELDKGHYAGKVPSSSLREIRSNAKEIEFFDMDKKYDDPGVTDLPSRITYLSFDGKEKEVLNRYKGPDELKKLESLLHGIVEDTKWEEKPSTD